MKRTICLLAVALSCRLAPPAVGAEPPHLFTAEPPEPAAALLAEAYLSLLAAGEFDSALALQDLRGMRQYLLERRMADLKTKNPELTAANLDEMSAHIQVTDLAPARLNQVMLDIMTEAGYSGMTWTLRGFAPAPNGLEGTLVSVDARTAAGQEKPVLLGLVKLGDQWMISPALIEQMMSLRPVVRVGPGTAAPAEVAALVRSFWTPFQTGEIQEAYERMAPAYRSRVPLLGFLGQAQDFLATAGVPTAWTIIRGVETEPGALFVGVNVQGSRESRPTLMRFRKMGQTWAIEDVRFEMPAPQAPAPAGEPAPLSRPDLRPAIDIE